MPSGDFLLLVDDNRIEQDLVVQAFLRCGSSLRIHLAGDGEEALSLLSCWSAHGNQLPKLVLLDLGLPRLGGLEVLEEIRRHQELRRLHVVIFSNSRDICSAHSAYLGGANAYVIKPETFDDLVVFARLIDKYVNQASKGRPEGVQ